MLVNSHNFNSLHASRRKYYLYLYEKKSVMEKMKMLEFLSMGTGEPDDAKVSCPVRGGTGRKGSNDLARGLPYLVPRSRFQPRLKPSVRCQGSSSRWEIGIH